MKYHHSILRSEYIKYAEFLKLPQDKIEITKDNLEWSLENINPLSPKPYLHVSVWEGYCTRFRRIIKRLLNVLEEEKKNETRAGRS